MADLSTGIHCGYARCRSHVACRSASRAPRSAPEGPGSRQGSQIETTRRTAAFCAADRRGGRQNASRRDTCHRLPRRDIMEYARTHPDCRPRPCCDSLSQGSLATYVRSLSQGAIAIDVRSRADRDEIANAHVMSYRRRVVQMHMPADPCIDGDEDPRLNDDARAGRERAPNDGCCMNHVCVVSTGVV